MAATRSWPEQFEASQQAVQTSNPIRKIVDHRREPKDPNKKLIPLDIGDPTKYGNMETDESVKKLLIKNIESNNYNGYAHSCGQPSAREAVAKYVGDNLTADDVVLTSGCSGALELSLTVLANPGENILLPQPGFSLYQTIADSKGIEVKHYNLLPEKNWEVDTAHLESLIDEKTKGILINNPSNPCGSVFSEQHLKDILAVAERHAVPIIADEIYAHMVFEQETPYISVASLSTSVPILSVGGLAKRYLVPGWRLGWITIHDRHNRFVGVKQGLKNLTTLILGACTLIQSILPELFSTVPQSFYDQTTQMLKLHGNTLDKGLSAVPGLQCIAPQGAMYMMVKIDIDMFDDSINSDLDFFALLLEEESVSVLPGEVFGAKNFVRLVTCASVEVLQEAIERIEKFCKAHYK